MNQFFFFQTFEKVDILMSEWMGFYLLHESMLESVFVARDKFLRKGGLMLPSRAIIKAAPTSFNQTHAEQISFWQNVYGFDMSPAIEIAKIKYCSSPQV